MSTRTVTASVVVDGVTITGSATYELAEPAGPLVGVNEGRLGEFEAAVGKPVQVVRRYANGLNDALNKIDADLSAGRVPWVSLSWWPSSSERAQIIAACTSLTLLTYLHEADLGKGGVDAPTFVTRHNTLFDEADASNPNVMVGPIFTAYPYRNGSVAQWIPDRLHFLGGDGYRFYREAGSPPDPKTGNTGVDRSAAYIFGDETATGAPKSGGLAGRAAELGVPFAIGEISCHNVGTTRPAWWRASFAWMRATGNCLAACVFHSPLGESGSWLQDRTNTYTDNETDPARLNGSPTPDTLAALAEQL